MCRLSRVTVLVRALRVGDTHERRRAVARDTVQIVRGTVCVLFHRRVVARGLTALTFASTPSPRERPRFTRDP